VVFAVFEVDVVVVVVVVVDGSDGVVVVTGVVVVGAQFFGGDGGCDPWLPPAYAETANNEARDAAIICFFIFITPESVGLSY
jgi:hypothetical protein